MQHLTWDEGLLISTSHLIWNCFKIDCVTDNWLSWYNCIELVSDKPCEKPEIPNAIFENIRERYNHNQQVQYACAHGDNTKFTILCEQGVWTGIKECTGKGTQLEQTQGLGVIRFSIRYIFWYNYIIYTLSRQAQWVNM